MSPVGSRNAVLYLFNSVATNVFQRVDGFDSQPRTTSELVQAYTVKVGILKSSAVALRSLVVKRAPLSSSL